MGEALKGYLSDYLKCNSITRSQFARELGITRGQAHRLVAQGMAPRDRELRAKLQQINPMHPDQQRVEAELELRPYCTDPLTIAIERRIRRIQNMIGDEVRILLEGNPAARIAATIHEGHEYPDEELRRLNLQDPEVVVVHRYNGHSYGRPDEELRRLNQNDPECKQNDTINT